MPKPRKVVRPVEKNISIPETTCTRVDLLLFSELEQRVPHGAWSRLIVGLLDAWLKKQSHAQAATLTTPLQGE